MEQYELCILQSTLQVLLIASKHFFGCEKHHFLQIKSKVTSEISPVGRGTVHCADSEAAESVVMQLPVPHPKPQQDSVYVIFRGRLQRKDIQLMPNI